MVEFITKRLIALIPILFGISLVSFILIHLVPVDPAEAYLNLSNTGTSQQALEVTRSEMGLNQPLIVQYARWLWDVARLDFGNSYVSKKPVWDELTLYIPATLALACGAVLLMLMISVPIGIFSAIYKDRLFDHFSRFFVFAASSIPSFWLGFLIVYIFAMKLDLFPLMGRGTLANLVLPSLTLALAYCSALIRLLRTGILDNKKQPFVLFAKLRGIKESRILGKHVLKNALPPVITALSISLGHMLAGTVIIENVFAWPGVGRYLVSSIMNRDYPVIQCYVLLMGILFVVLNLLADIICAVLDPRIRWKGEH